MSGAETGSLRCIAIRSETPSIKTFVFAPAAPLPHAAGQAMALGLPGPDGLLWRSFSIASPPGAAALEFTIKRQPEGQGTRYLHERLCPGDEVLARRPRGQFTLGRRQADAPLALVSAGSGASPLIAMLRALAVAEPEADLAWLHVARSQSDILFAEELARLQAQMPRLAATILLTAPLPGWFGYRGRPDRRLLSAAIPDFARRDVFCCGPAGFMAALRLIHAAEGGAPGRFHTERFRADMPRAETAPVAAAPAGETNALCIGAHALDIRADETVLQAAIRQSVIIPCGCGEGLCGTCRVELVEGQIAMRHQGGLSPEEEEAGFILACSSYARGPLRIKL